MRPITTSAEKRVRSIPVSVELFSISLGHYSIFCGSKGSLFTNDKDFGELTFFQKKHSVGIVLIRVKNQQTRIKLELMNKLLSKYGEKILNHFVVITETKFRFISMGDIK